MQKKYNTMKRSKLEIAKLLLKDDESIRANIKISV